jgi:hypothetical protein
MVVKLLPGMNRENTKYSGLKLPKYEAGIPTTQP